MIKVNGEAIGSDPVRLLDFLQSRGYDPKRIAVERNEEIVPKARYESCTLMDGDQVEIVRFVGGG